MGHNKTWIAHAAAGTVLLAGAVAASVAKRRESTGTVTSSSDAYSDYIDDDWFYDNCQIQFASPLPHKAEQLYDDAWTSGLFDF